MKSKIKSALSVIGVGTAHDLVAIRDERDRLRDERDRLRDERNRANEERNRLSASLDKLRRGKVTLPPELRPRQLCFLHIGKNAGTSLQYMLLDALPDAEVFHASLPQFDEAAASDLAASDFILGHFTFQHVAKFRANRFLFTFLREPTERVVSLYFFMRGRPGRVGPDSPPDPNSVVALQAAQSLSFKQFLLSDDPKIRMYTSNQQTKILAYDHRPDYLGDASDMLSRAETNLAQFAFVGITELFDESVHALSEKLALNEPLTPRKLNINEKRETLESLDEDVVDIVRQLNLLDAKLYQKALSDFERAYLRGVTFDEKAQKSPATFAATGD